MSGDALATYREMLARHVRANTAALIAAWRAAVIADPLLTTGDSLPRAQLEDHLPGWLESFAAVLAAAPGDRVSSAAEVQAAEAHGLQRWQQGYDLHEVTREWGSLHRCMVVAIERFAQEHPEFPGAVLAEARIKLAEQLSEAVSTSAEKYFRLERVEAAGSVRDLERALANVLDLERQRAELWQQAAHDLRGNLGVVSNVAQGLTFAELPAEKRRDFLALLRNNVTALHHLLDDVTALARLQAGQEQRRVERFDAAQELSRLAADMRPLADEKSLALSCEGPAPLEVQGDRVKVRRIVQNLLLNALKYTTHGGVTLTWGDSAAGDDSRWFILVEDTGPGFHAGPGAPIVEALGTATAESNGHPLGSEEAAPGDHDVRPVHQSQGEGLGLAIVKRLCDLLNATVELETAPGQGTSIRVLVPRRYASAST